MPLFMIERSFAEQLELTSEDVNLIEEINDGEGVHWLFSFLSAADKVVEVGAGTPEFSDRLQGWAAAQADA